MCILTFVMFLYFLKIIQFFTSFFTDVLGIADRITSLKKPFYSISTSVKSHFEVFWGSFWGILLHFLELFLILSYKIFYRWFLYYSENQCDKKNFTSCLPLLGALYSLFWVYSSISSEVKTFSRFFTWMSWYYCGVH